VKTTPLAHSGIALAAFQKAKQIVMGANGLFQNSMILRFGDYCGKEVRKDMSVYLEPIEVFYQQNSTQGDLIFQGQPGFRSHTYGATLGCNKFFFEQLIFNVAGSYTYSNFSWTKKFGYGHANSYYLSPFLGWFDGKNFVDVSVLGGVNFFQKNRRIAFSSIDRIARSDYRGYSLLTKVHGGRRFALSDSLWLQPELSLDFFTEFFMKSQEKGAGVLDVQIKKRNVYVLQPSADLRIIKDFTIGSSHLDISLYAGWLMDIYFADRIYYAYYKVASSKTLYSYVRGYDTLINQMLLGTDFTAWRCNTLALTGAFEANIFDSTNIYTARMRFDWSF
jgi:uncharacterized protein with beta-barrel porin domain